MWASCQHAKLRTMLLEGEILFSQVSGQFLNVRAWCWTCINKEQQGVTRLETNLNGEWSVPERERLMSDLITEISWCYKVRHYSHQWVISTRVWAPDVRPVSIRTTTLSGEWSAPGCKRLNFRSTVRVTFILWTFFIDNLVNFITRKIEINHEHCTVQPQKSELWKIKF